MDHSKACCSPCYHMGHNRHPSGNMRQGHGVNPEEAKEPETLEINFKVQYRLGWMPFIYLAIVPLAS